ncbi:MAG: glutathione S-transferase family protein [Candidatus Thiodiazotropha sp.]|jgi:glutathione S-transferase
MTTLTLYDLPLSGNCYKVRLLLSMLNLDYTRVMTDTRKGETLTPEFKRLNPRGQIPVFIDGHEIIWDSMAILVYLGRKFGDDTWLPDDPLSLARVMQWLAVSENELLYGLARARAVVVLNRPFDLEQCHRDALPGVEAMEQRLTDCDWLALDHPTLADVACYPYTVMAGEGRFSLEPYPGIRNWLKRFEQLPGWCAMLE